MTRRKTILKLARGYYGRSKNCYRLAVNRVLHGLQHAYRMRRTKKRILRQLWITNINAAAQEFGLKYSQFMRGLTLAGVQLNRKMLAEISQTEPLSMRSIAECSTSARKAAKADYNEAAILAELNAPKMPKYYKPFEEIEEVMGLGKKPINPHLEMKMDKVREILSKVDKDELEEDEIYEQRLIEEMKKKNIPEKERTKLFTV